MQTPALFKKFDFSIASSAETANIQPLNIHQPCSPVPLVNIKINFEDGLFKLEGDWHFMIASNKHAEKSWFKCHANRVNIDAVVYPGFAIDLTDDNNDGLVFAIDGSIKDGNSNDACSGLMILDKVISNDGASINQWNISFYLYDNAHDDCEITFRIPLYANPAGGHLN